MSKKDRNKGLYSTLCYLHETLAQVKVTWNNGMMEFKTGVTSEKAMTQKGPRELARGRRPSWSWRSVGYMGVPLVKAHLTGHISLICATHSIRISSINKSILQWVFESFWDKNKIGILRYEKILAISLAARSSFFWSVLWWRAPRSSDAQIHVKAPGQSPGRGA